MRAWIAATAAGLVLAACTMSEPPKVDENAPPVAYTDRLMDEIRKRLGDPTGIRDAFISEPVLRPVDGKTLRQVVCVRFTPPAQGGRVIGSVEMAGIFYSQQLTSLTTAEAKKLCPGVAYRPFPELEKLCKEVVCPKER